MPLNIKEVLKNKKMQVSELADILGINRVSLSQQINGNPTLDTLQKIANALDVEVWELFTHNNKEDFTALVDHRGKLYKASSVEELERIIAEIKNETN